MGNQIINPIQLFTDLDGRPLDGGYVWIGQPNENPLTNPVTVYRDAATTIPMTQPLRTTQGYLASGGRAFPVYTTQSDYSVLVLDKHGRTVWSQPSVASPYALVNTFMTSLAAPAGTSLVGYQQVAPGSTPRSLQARLDDFSNLLNFSDDLTDPSYENAAEDIATAVQYALTAIARTGAGGAAYATRTLWMPPGVINLLSPVTIAKVVAQSNVPDQGSILLRGEGRGATIFALRTAGMYGFQLSGESVNFQDLMAIDGTGGGTPMLFQLGKADNSTSLAESYFRNIKTYGLAKTFEFGWAFDCKFERIFMSGVGVAGLDILANTSDNCNNLFFDQVHGEPANDGAVFLRSRTNPGGGDPNLLTFISPHFETHSNIASALDLQGGHALTFVNPTFIRNGGDATYQQSIPVVKLTDVQGAKFISGVVQHVGPAHADMPMLVDYEGQTADISWDGTYFVNPTGGSNPTPTVFELNNSTLDAVGSTIDYNDILINTLTGQARYNSPRPVSSRGSGNRSWRLLPDSANSDILAIQYSTDPLQQGFGSKANLSNTSGALQCGGIGMMGGYQPTVPNGSTTIFNTANLGLPGGNASGRGIFMIYANAPDDCAAIVWTNGAQMYTIFVGTAMAVAPSNSSSTNPNTAGKFNVYLSSGNLAVNNQYGSDRQVAVVPFTFF